MLFYPCGSLLIIYDLRIMLSSINLNDDTLFQAHKVDNILSKGVLPAEFVSSKLT